MLLLVSQFTWRELQTLTEFFGFIILLANSSLEKGMNNSLLVFVARGGTLLLLWGLVSHPAEVSASGLVARLHSEEALEETELKDAREHNGNALSCWPPVHIGVVGLEKVEVCPWPHPSKVVVAPHVEDIGQQLGGALLFWILKKIRFSSWHLEEKEHLPLPLPN